MSIDQRGSADSPWPLSPRPEGNVSGTLDAMAHDPSQPRETNTSQGGYGALWRGVPRELGYLLPTLPIVVIGFVLVQVLFSVGLGTLALVIGLFVLVGALYVARAFGTLELVRLEAAGTRPVQRPRWAPIEERRGFWRTTLGPLVNGHYWMYLLHTGLVGFLLGVFSWSVAFSWLASGLGGISYWFWNMFIPDGDTFWLSDVIYRFFTSNQALPIDPDVADGILLFLTGLAFLATLPFVTRGLTLLNGAVARGMLSRWPSDDLRTEVAALAASRGAAVSAEDQSVRRLERDIHDGPQQRLVRLQMDLATAERRLESDPDAARKLIAEARNQAQSSLDELRALSRGFAPPILEDRGLVSAVESLAAMSSIPVTVTSTLMPGVRLPSEIERNVYFVIAELLTNASKHSGASGVRVEISTTPDSGAGRRLQLVVADDGVGGAGFDDGHGLSGLRDRITGLRGALWVDSPEGQGTRVTASVPGIEI